MALSRCPIQQQFTVESRVQTHTKLLDGLAFAFDLQEIGRRTYRYRNDYGERHQDDMVGEQYGGTSDPL